MIACALRWLVYALLLSAFAGETPVPAAGSPTENASKSVTITSQNPVGYFPVAPEILASKPPILFVSITNVVNPTQTSLEIFVYLARLQKDDVGGQKVLVGKFSLYPPDKPGGFQLSSSDAFRKLEAGSGVLKAGTVKIAVEMRRIGEGEPEVELTLTPPQWRSGKSK
jgi:hypothetical protein